jgi:FkbM family methyltransferase
MTYRSARAIGVAYRAMPDRILLHMLAHRRVPRRFRDSFTRLRAGSLAIDLGANVGRFTQVMAASGATVHAFEPNPYVFEALRRRFSSAPNVTLYPVAASDGSGVARLHLHRNADRDQVLWSVGSSLLVEKGNVESDRFVEVETIDFAEFLTSLDRSVALVKMDIEGAEIRVLERLLEAGRLTQIERLLVETHGLPERESVEEIRRRIERVHSHARFDWV